MPAITRIFVVVLLLACSCQAGELPESKGRSEWTGKEVAKVVGYRFKGPDDDPVEIVSGEKIDLKLLKKNTKKSAQLSAGQVNTLLDALFNPAHRLISSACYDPHPIFVFYAQDGHPLRAVEVCFDCGNLVTNPDLGEKFDGQHDLVALARLTAALGRWPKDKTVEQFIDLQKGREHEPEPAE